MKKRLISILLALTLSLGAASLVACNDDNTEENTIAPPTQTET